MILSHCDSVYGGETLLKGAPRIDSYEDILFVPENYMDSAPGCYDRGKKLITASGVFLGIPDNHLIFGDYFTNLDALNYEFAEKTAHYFYLGPINTHYGHFLTITLSRLWWVLNNNIEDNIKIVYSDKRTPEDLFSIPYIGEIFNILGLKESNFINSTIPVRFEKITIPEPSFEENNFVYEIFAKFCNHIGDEIEVSNPASISKIPVYLAKTKINSGVSRIKNEHIICERLKKNGIEIIFPEKLNFRQQVMIFREHPIVLGSMGSALHTGIFTPKNNIIGISYGNEIWSNQLLFDKANQNNSIYFYPKGNIYNIGRDEYFGNNFIITDPIGVADELSVNVDNLLSIKGFSPLLNKPKSELPFINGKIISKDKPTTQSSISLWSKKNTVELDSAGAVSGFLKGTYQFHTDFDENAWWQVDLEEKSYVTGVLLFNRFEGLEHRSARLKLLGSYDGENWEVLTIRDENFPFGGIDGNPYKWQPEVPVEIRFLRVQIIGKNYLHLDQVQVFGFSKDNPDHLCYRLEESEIWAAKGE